MLFRSPGGLVVISHDRAFLNALCTGMLEMRGGTLHYYHGNYDNFLQEKEARKAQQAAQYKNQQREIAHLQKFVDRFGAKASLASRAKSKEKQIERLQENAIEEPTEELKRINFKFPQPPRSGLKVIELEHIEQAYGEHIVYRDLNFTAERGQRIVLVGPNGAGKSTLLNCISGLIAVTRGSIKLEGKDITNEAAFRISRSGLLQVPEGRRVFPNLPVRENLELGSYRRGRRNRARNLDRGDPSKVIYSVTLYEHRGNANILRIQTDNFDNPFSINEGTRLDLGSTAKLRTLTTYLDIVGELYDRYSGTPPEKLRKIDKQSLDPISTFVVNEFIKSPQLTLSSLLTRALQRRYSASPYESFFTGGGMHTFENFKKEDNGRNPTIQEALTASINLPFVRLMRDLSRYYIAQMGLKLSGSKTDRANPLRMHFLRKFADQEGSYFMRRFHEKYRGKPSNRSEEHTSELQSH